MSRPCANETPPPRRSDRRRRWRHLRRRFRNRIIAWVGPPFLRLWMLSVRIRTVARADVRPHRRPRNGQIYAFWHQRLLGLTYISRGTGIRVLISRHGDGDMIASVTERLGLGAVRGSSTRGGVRAVRELLESHDPSCDYAFTPDGPRGPRHVFQSGAVYFASRSGLPIVLATLAYRRAWRLRTWDEFIVPRPFTRGVFVTSEPIAVPPDLDREELETWRRRLEDDLRELTENTDRDIDRLFERGLALREYLRTGKLAETAGNEDSSPATPPAQ